MKRICYSCNNETEGGTYLNKVLREPTTTTFNNKNGGTNTFKATKTKLIYFCSGDCLEKYEKKNKIR